MRDHFADDAAKVSDPEWTEYGLLRGWALLTQDLRMATQSVVIGMIQKHQGPIFYLDSAELPILVRADRFHSRQPAMWQMVRDRRSGFYIIGESGHPYRRRGTRPD